MVAGFQDCPTDLFGWLDASELARVAQAGALIAPIERPAFDAWRCSAAHCQQLPAAHELLCVASSPRQAGGAVEWSQQVDLARHGARTELLQVRCAIRSNHRSNHRFLAFFRSSVEPVGPRPRPSRVCYTHPRGLHWSCGARGRRRRLVGASRRPAAVPRARSALEPVWSRVEPRCGSSGGALWQRCQWQQAALPPTGTVVGDAWAAGAAVVACLGGVACLAVACRAPSCHGSSPPRPR